MTPARQPHCDHECVCPKYAMTNAWGYPCTRNTGLMGTVCTAPCEHDTRTHSSPPAAEPEDDGIVDLLMLAEMNKRVEDRLAIIRVNAAKAERERVLKELAGKLDEKERAFTDDGELYFLSEDVESILESLREQEEQ